MTEQNLETSAPSITTNNLPTIKTLEETGIQNFGNNIASALIQQIAFDDELASLSEAAEQSRTFIGFELTKAIMQLQQDNDKINIYAIWDNDRKAVERLNSRVLVAMGVMTREADPEKDEVSYKWTDPKVKDLYDYGTAADKEKDEATYNRRLSNRKRLNISLSNAYKAAIALIDNGNTAENLTITQEEGKAPVALIANAPLALAGENKDNKPVEFGKRTVATGATHSPTMASLIKIATTKHKVEDEGKTGERADKGADRSGDAKIGISDEDFGTMVNTLKRTIIAQEGKFTPDMVKQSKSLIPVLQGVLDAAAAETAAAAAAKQTGKAKAKDKTEA